MTKKQRGSKSSSPTRVSFTSSGNARDAEDTDDSDQPLAPTLREMSDGCHRLCEASYDNNPKEEIEIEMTNRDGTKVKIKAKLDGRTSSTGMPRFPHLRLYKFSFNGQRYSVFVSRGTHEFWTDVITDCELASLSGAVPPRFVGSAEYVTSLMSTLANTRVLFTGHSLGGAEAEYLAVLFEKESIAFDNPGCKTIIEKSLKHRKVRKERHLTENGNPNLINRAATWFTGGPVGEVIHGNSGIFDILDGLLIVMLVVLVLLLSLPSVSGATLGINILCILMVFGAVCFCTMQHHSLADRSRIAYYTENAPAGGHLILSVVLMLCALGWLTYKGSKWVWEKVSSPKV